MSKKSFWLLILSSFILQIVLGFYETYGDVHAYFVPWAQSIEKFGATGFYDRVIPPNTYANYPPLIIYVLTAFHSLGNFLIKPTLSGLWSLNTAFSFFPSGIVTFFNRDNLLLFSFIKLPNIIANIVLAVGAYFLIKELIPKKAKTSLPQIALVSVLFNPALVFLSALWGQVDVLPFAFVVWSFYAASRKSYNLSVFLMAIALLFKQTAVLAVPFYALYLFDRLSIKRVITWSAIVYATFVVAFWPFGKSMGEKLFPFLSYLKIVSSFASDKVSMHAHNFWQMVYPNMKDYGVRTLSQVLVFAFLAHVIYRIWEKRKDLSQVMTGLGLFSLFSFMFMTRMHERHLLAAIPFLLIAMVVDFKFYWIFVFESLYLLVNMYAAWPIPYSKFLAESLNNYWVVSAITVVQIGVMGWAVSRWLKTARRKTGAQ